MFSNNIFSESLEKEPEETPINEAELYDIGQKVILISDTNYLYIGLNVRSLDQLQIIKATNDKKKMRTMLHEGKISKIANDTLAFVTHKDITAFRTFIKIRTLEEKRKNWVGWITVNDCKVASEEDLEARGLSETEIDNKTDEKTRGADETSNSGKKEENSSDNSKPIKPLKPSSNKEKTVPKPKIKRVNTPKDVEVEDLSKEVGSYEKAIPHLVKGNGYFSKREYKKAIEEFKKAIEIKPNYQSAHKSLAKSYKKIGMDNEAAKEEAIAKSLSN